MNENRSMDSRTRRTRAKLWSGLIALMDEKEFSAISVSDIAEHAGVNRVTFYRHFTDKNDLLLRGLEKTMGDVIEQLEPYADIGTESVAERNYVRIFRHVYNNRKLYRALVGPDGTGVLVAGLKDYFGSAYIRHMSARLGAPRLPTRFVADFVSSAFIGVIARWIFSDAPESPEVMAKQFVTIITHGVYYSLALQ
ncbi:MAG: TetR family transcriptional regulator [Spirochaetaceae bacterium]|nr:MAG: TetR family transcriptional regulator [Spirochaetaceae bacterium]